MLLNPEVLTILILDFLFLFFGSIAFILSIKIFLRWDLNSTSQKQYLLEKQSFLASTIIKYIFMLKIPLFLFFIFTLDKIANILTGAMCGAGVVDATNYGVYLLLLKILNIYIFAFWLALHFTDIKDEKQPYTKLKFGIFILIFFLFLGELILEYLMFSNININQMVDCCGTLYSNTAQSYISYIFKIDNLVILEIFYTTYVLMIISYFIKNKYFYTLLNLFFIFISIISLIVFFGTYIYELPTHHCPFCFLQKDYYYIGYFIYSLLFLGTFNGMLSIFSNKLKLSIFLNSIFVFILTTYPIVFYIKNGVWL